MKVVAIIQVRMGSSRLPGKVLQKIGHETVLARVINRVRRSSEIHDVLIATTNESADDVIIAECERLAAPVFRGNDNDVLDRYHAAAHFAEADVIVRITSDCPLIDPQVTDLTIKAFHAQQPDYASNALERTYPRGLDTEVFSLAALDRTWLQAQQAFQRSHVTPYIYQNPNIFRLLAVKGEANFSFHRWTVDTPADLELVRAIFERFDYKDDFSWLDVVALLEREPALVELNLHVIQKGLIEG